MRRTARHGHGRRSRDALNLQTMEKKLIWLGLFVGSWLGGMAPRLWGAGFFSGWGVLCSVLGGFLGIAVGYKVGRMFF